MKNALLILLLTLGILLTNALADGSVLKTGQIKSYDQDGNDVTRCEIKDDGCYQAGVTRSYSDMGGMVKDNTTKLLWQDNASNSSSWNDAINYCKNIQFLYNNTFYENWRLPTVQELQTLVDYSQYSPPLTEGTFHISSDTDYWSSSVAVQDNNKAWIVSFYSYGDILFLKKDITSTIRCVWGESLTHPKLSRNNETEIVTDKTTGLQWQDNVGIITVKRNWINAINYCESTLSLGGYHDWRLPNINEILSIVRYSQSDPAVDTFRFKYTAPSAALYYTYWSSTSSVSYSNQALGVNFNDGSLSSGYKETFNYYVRCVRGGHKDTFNPSTIMYLLN